MATASDDSSSDWSFSEVRAKPITARTWTEQSDLWVEMLRVAGYPPVLDGSWGIECPDDLRFFFADLLQPDKRCYLVDPSNPDERCCSESAVLHPVDIGHKLIRQFFEDFDGGLTMATRVAALISSSFGFTGPYMVPTNAPKTNLAHLKHLAIEDIYLKSKFVLQFATATDEVSNELRQLIEPLVTDGTDAENGVFDSTTVKESLYPPIYVIPRQASRNDVGTENATFVLQGEKKWLEKTSRDSTPLSELEAIVQENWQGLDGTQSCEVVDGLIQEGLYTLTAIYDIAYHIMWPYYSQTLMKDNWSDSDELFHARFELYRYGVMLPVFSPHGVCLGGSVGLSKSDDGQVGSCAMLKLTDEEPAK